MTIPTIAHAAVYVRDLEGTRAFYETYFAATSNDGYHNPRTGLRTYFLSFGGATQLEIMSRPDVTARADDGLGWAHLAFKLGSAQAVDALAARLASDGFVITNGPRTTGDGYYEAVVLDPEGNPVELVA